MVDDQSAKATDELHWMQAAAFMDLYGDRWPDEAATALKNVSIGNPEGFADWTDLIEKMTAIHQSSRQ